MRLPGLIDVHVHMREPGAIHKEDWASGTSAALAGGFTLVLAMPNTDPPIFSEETFEVALSSARKKSYCDFGLYVGAGPDNYQSVTTLAPLAAGLKMYLDMTYGELRLDNMILWQNHFLRWPVVHPLVVHAESRTMAAAVLFAALFDRHIHIAHVSSQEEILIIKAAKEKGIKVSCEVAPHHLFLSSDDFPEISQSGKFPGRQEVRPRLTTKRDQEALWENLDVIDCFATDHAPHTLNEKDSDTPPPGFPGLETALPLLLTAVNQGRLTIDDLVVRLYENPKKIFKLPDQYDTWIEIDPGDEYVLKAENSFSRCGWTPFEGTRVRGRVKRINLRGQLAFEDGKVHVEPGYGKNIRTMN